MVHLAGQAVLDGVMMRSPNGLVVAVRRADGTIAVREERLSSARPALAVWRWPGVRGAVALFEALHQGASALLFSVEQVLPLPPRAFAKDRARTGGVGGAALVASSLVLAAGLFIVAPHLLTFAAGARGPAFHLLDGAFRVAILLAYVWAVSRLSQMERVFQCHGAEHMAIWAYESNAPLTVKSARGFGTVHPRCGTSFLFAVVAVAVAAHLVVLPLVPRLFASPLLQQLALLLVKVALAVPVAACAYELQRWSSRPSCPRIVLWLTRPGLWLQRFTAKKPTDDQLFVALLALQRCLALEEGSAGEGGVYVYEGLKAAA